MASTITDTRQPQVQRYVFVYGTLRKGQERDINHLRPAPLFIGNAQVKGTLYNLGSYPGLHLTGDQPVQGEVYQITPELERQLDEIEEVWPEPNGEYVRREVAVQCAATVLTCLVYEVAQAHTKGKLVIASGDWLKR